MMKEIKRETGQVILETAIVLASIAALAISSTVLFSNLNRNMVARMDKFRDSRLTAVNNPGGSTVTPQSFLDYSPFIEIITERNPHGDITIPPLDPDDPFSSEFFDDPRLEQAELLLDQANDIINFIIPYKVGAMFYTYLDGDSGSLLRDGNGELTDNYDYNYIWNNISFDEARISRDLCNELLQDMNNYNQYTELSALRAYDNLYEDINGIDSDGDGFLGVIGLLQSVLDSPIEDGPFDPDLGCIGGDTTCLNRQARNMDNRLQLQGSIDSILPTRSGIDTLYYGSSPEPGLIGRLTTARDNLNRAVNDWNHRTWHGFLFFGYWHYDRPDWIGTAVAALRLPAELIREAESQPVTNDMADKIIQAYDLLQPEVTFEDLDQARWIVYFLSLDPETREPVPIIYNIIEDALNFLTSAVGGWWGPDREILLELARQKLGVLYDIVSVGR